MDYRVKAIYFNMLEEGNGVQHHGHQGTYVVSTPEIRVGLIMNDLVDGVESFNYVLEQDYAKSRKSK